jgi:hypothetical protein
MFYCGHIVVRWMAYDEKFDRLKLGNAALDLLGVRGTSIIKLSTTI